MFAITFEPGTDKPVSLAELVDYCKILTEGADGSIKPVNTGSPNVTALSDLKYAAEEAEACLEGSADEQAAALRKLREAFEDCLVRMLLLLPRLFIRAKI